MLSPFFLFIMTIFIAQLIRFVKYHTTPSWEPILIDFTYPYIFFVVHIFILSVFNLVLFIFKAIATIKISFLGSWLISLTLFLKYEDTKCKNFYFSQYISTDERTIFFSY